jgi:hypothetical protein
VRAAEEQPYCIASMCWQTSCFEARLEAKRKSIACDACIRGIFVAVLGEVF